MDESGLAILAIVGITAIIIIAGVIEQRYCYKKKKELFSRIRSRKRVIKLQEDK